MYMSDRAFTNLVARGDIYVRDGTNFRLITEADNGQDLLVKLHDGSYTNYPPINNRSNHPPPGQGRSRSGPRPPVPVVIQRTPPEDETDREIQHIAKQVDRGVVAVWNGLGCIVRGIIVFIAVDLAIWALLIIWGLIATGGTHFN